LQLVFVPAETIIKYQGAQITSYPILNFLRWILLDFVGYVFL